MNHRVREEIDSSVDVRWHWKKRIFTPSICVMRWIFEHMFLRWIFEFVILWYFENSLTSWEELDTSVHVDDCICVFTRSVCYVYWDESLSSLDDWLSSWRDCHIFPRSVCHVYYDEFLSCLEDSLISWGSGVDDFIYIFPQSVCHIRWDESLSWRYVDDPLSSWGNFHFSRCWWLYIHLPT